LKDNCKEKVGMDIAFGNSVVKKIFESKPEGRIRMGRPRLR
jgi:hypothetical protein